MGLLSNVLKAGIAAKLLDEARKPQNQRRAKEFAQRLLRNRSKR